MFSSIRILSSKLRKALAQLPNLPRALALVYLTKLFVDAIMLTLRSHDDFAPVRHAFMVALILGGVLLLMEVVRHTINWVSNVQAELLQDHITALIHEKSVTADLAFYELADYYDHLHRARTEARYR